MQRPIGRTIVLASPRGFCAGVRLAVELAQTALQRGRRPLYALNELVHNRQVVEAFEAAGLQVVRNVAEVPEGATVLFSAHGVAPAVRAQAAARRLAVLDASCPFVLKVHAEVARFARHGCTIAYIGHRNHEEVIGVCGEAPEQVTVLETPAEAERFQPPDPDRVAVAMQTTWSAAEAGRVLAVLRRRFPRLRTPPKGDICYATTNRQEAVKALAGRVGTILVLGGRNSSNTLRLAEVAQQAGARAFRLSEAADLAAVPLHDVPALGMTAGASTPERFITEILGRLRTQGFDRVEELETIREHVHFDSSSRIPAD